MNASMTFSACSLVYSILLVIIYFSRRKLKTVENNLYSGLIISNFIGIILAILCYYTIGNMDSFPILNMIVSKALLVYYLTWISIFTAYVFVVSNKTSESDNVKQRQFYNKLILVLGSLYIVILLLVCLLPLYFHNENGIIYSYGPSANLLYMVVPLYITTFFICMIKNLKVLKNKKFVPLLVFIVIGTVVMIVQKLNPGLLLMTSMETFITFLMYFTIENPDLQVLEEYHDLHELNTKRNIDKETEVYNLRQRVRFPVMEIEERSNLLLEKINDSEVKDEVREIANLSKKTLLSINNLMDVDKLDNYYLKKSSEKYNPKLLFEQIIRSVKPLNEIDFTYHIDSNIPDNLLGDSMHLKSVIRKILELSLEKTIKGSVRVNITSIIKNNICRLYLELVDTSKGYSNRELEDIYKVDGAYSDIKRILDNLGGSIVVNSEKGVGNNIIVLLDQKVYVETHGKLDKLNDDYKKNRVLVVTQDNKTIKAMESVLKKGNYDFDIVNLGVECLHKIRNHDRYSLIVLDSNTEPLNGMEIYNKLLEIKDFDIDVVMMSDNANFKVKNYYLDNGIKDIISLPIDKKQALLVINELHNKE